MAGGRMEWIAFNVLFAGTYAALFKYQLKLHLLQHYCCTGGTCIVGSIVWHHCGSMPIMEIPNI